MQWQQENTTTRNRTQEEINTLVNSHKKIVADYRLTYKPYHFAVFMSDTHFPYHDVDALHLAYEIISDLPEVSYISGLSDGFDFSLLSRWPDGRNAREQAIDSNLRGVLDAYCYHLDTLRQVAPNALVLALVGNHDTRLLNSRNGLEDYLQLEVMKELSIHGLLFLSDFSRENIVKINNSLYWFHGKHARMNRLGGAKANYEYVKGALNLDRDFTLVFGHVHDPVVYNHLHAYAYGSGCLSQLNPHYSRFAQKWQQGITISKLWDNQNLTFNIPFVRLEGKLTAFNPFNGKDYEVKNNE
jgi:predicted phosphodiesterase